MICQDQRTTRGHRSHTRLASHASYRIQVQDADLNAWRLYANFSFRGEAEACLDALRLRGIAAELVIEEPAQSSR